MMAAAPGRRPGAAAAAAVTVALVLALAPACAGGLRVGEEDVRLSAVGAEEAEAAERSFGDSAGNYTTEWVNVEVENDTPYDIGDLVVIHKYFGVDPPVQELYYNNISKGATSASQPVLTTIGALALRQDWWLVTWRFKNTTCPVCLKEDGRCETWVSSPDNKFGVLMMDPLTYVKIAAVTANIAVGVASLGTATLAGVAATSLLTEALTSYLTKDDVVDGFKACGVNSIDAENSKAGQPIRIRITPVPAEDDLATPRFVVQLLLFEEGQRGVRHRIAPAEPEVRWHCNMPAAAMPCQVKNDLPGETVNVTVINRSGRRIKRWSVLHKYNGLTPPVHIVDSTEPLALGARSDSRNGFVKTTTTWGFRNDWWIVGWHYEDAESQEEACQVHAMMDDGFMKEIVSHPEQYLVSIGSGIAGAAIGVLADLPSYYNGLLSMGHYGLGGLASNDVHSDTLPARKIYGLKLLDLLAHNSNVRGFLQCNLIGKDVADSAAGKPLEIIIGATDVTIRAGGGDDATACVGQVRQLGCVHSKECRKLDKCKPVSGPTTTAAPGL